MLQNSNVGTIVKLLHNASTKKFAYVDKIANRQTDVFLRHY